MMMAKVKRDQCSECWNEGEGSRGAWIYNVRYKMRSQRGRDSNHKATAEFVDAIFSGAYKRAALMHHCNKTFVFLL